MSYLHNTVYALLLKPNDAILISSAFFSSIGISYSNLYPNECTFSIISFQLFSPKSPIFIISILLLLINLSIVSMSCLRNAVYTLVLKSNNSIFNFGSSFPSILLSCSIFFLFLKNSSVSSIFFSSNAPISFNISNSSSLRSFTHS